MLPRLRAVASWKNATGALDRAATLRGILRPGRGGRAGATCAATPAVAEPLRPFVERYWSVRWDLTGQPPFRSEVLSHPSVNVSVESGTAAAVRLRDARRPRARRGHPPLHRRPGRRGPGDRGQVPPRAASRAFTGVLPGAQRRRAGSGPSSGSPADALLRRRPGRGRTTTRAPPSSTRPCAPLRARTARPLPRPARPASARWPTTAASCGSTRWPRSAGMSVRSLQRLFATLRRA